MKKALASIAAFALPVTVAFAQVLPQGGSDIFDWVNILRQLLNAAVPILIAFAVIFLIVNVIKFMTSDGDAREDAKKLIGKSLLGIFIIVAFWGLILLVSKTLGVGIGGTIEDQYRVQVVL